MTDHTNHSPTLESLEANLLAQRAADNVRFSRLEARQDAMEAEQAVMRADIARLDAKMEAVRRDTAARVEGALQDLWTTLAAELSCVLSPQQLSRMHDVASARIHQCLSLLQT